MKLLEFLWYCFSSKYRARHQKFYFIFIHIYKYHAISYYFRKQQTAAVAQWVSAFVTQTEGWMYKSQPVVIPISDSSTASRSAIGVIVTGSRR